MYRKTIFENSPESCNQMETLLQRIIRSPDRVEDVCQGLLIQPFIKINMFTGI